MNDLRSMFNIELMEETGVRVEINCIVRSTFSKSPDKNRTIQQKNIIEFFANGAVREVAYEVAANGTLSLNPIYEALFDGKQFLSLIRDKKNEVKLIYFTDPTIVDTIGTRGHGLLPFLALTPFQTSDEWNLCSIIEEAGFTDRSRREGGIEIVASDTAVGRVTIRSDAKNRMEYLNIVADQPSDSFYGLKLERFRDHKIWQTFEGFRYVEPDPKRITGLAGFKASRIRHTVNRGIFRQDSEVTVNRFHPISQVIPRLSIEAVLRTALPDQMPIMTVGNPHLEFVYRNGRVEKVRKEKMASQLAAVGRNLNEGKYDSRELDWVTPSTSGFCGLYSLFAISQKLGTQTDLADLMEPEFCSSPVGSSASELQRAVHSIGLHSHIVAGLSVDDLAAISSPAILHVRPRGRADDFSHWIAFFGKNKEGTFDVLDSSFGFEKMSPSELASRFDGSALIVDQNRENISVSLGRLSRRRAVKGVLVGVLLLCITLGISFLARHTNRHGWIVVGIMLVFAAISVGYHTIRPDGLLGAELDVAKRLAENSTIDFPRVSIEDIRQIEAARDPAIALVDTRYSRDYLRGTIGNARSYPLDILPDIEERLVADLKSCDKVVVFCQSKTCPFSVQIGRRLKTMGVQNVFVYDGGYKEWSGRGQTR